MTTPQLTEHKLHSKEWETHTLNTLGLVALRSERQPSPLARFQLNGASGLMLRSASAIEEVLLSRSIKRSFLPWGEALKWPAARLALLHPQGQRTRPLSSAQEAMNNLKLNHFFDHWTKWVITDLRDVAESYPDQDLYALLRLVSMRVVARTLCVSLEGEALTPIIEQLEVLDTSAARLIFTGQGNRPAWLPGSDHKRVEKAMHELEHLVRKHVRDRIGGVSEDDLLSLWVETYGADGKPAGELEVISEGVGLLIMAYTALPKLLFGAAVSLSPSMHGELLPHLQREFKLAIEALNAPSSEGAPPSIKRDPARQSLRLHQLVAMEAERLYPPVWLVPYRAVSAGELGPIVVREGEELWTSPWANHLNPKLFKEPERFWPQRWGGQLEAQLPRYALAPYGVEGQPRFAERVCRELLPRLIMIWCELFEAQGSTEELSGLTWSLSLCLKPTTPVRWGRKGSAAQGEAPASSP